MKIVITVESFDPNKGYLEYYLARELTLLDQKVYVFTFNKYKNISINVSDIGFQVFRMPYFTIVNGYHVPSLNEINQIIKFIKKEKPDIIHCQPLISPLSLVFIGLQRFFNYKIVGTIYSQNPHLNTATKKVLNNLVKLISSYYIKNRSEIIFVKSKELMNIQKELYNIPMSKFRIIPMGSDTSLFKYSVQARKNIRSMLGLISEDLVIIYSGKLTPRKRLDILIKALAPIIKGDDCVKLLIVGKGIPSYERYIKKICRDSGVHENVIFHPWVHRTMLPDFYSASDIAVWPGLSSISIIEAASIGLPLIIEASPIEIYGIEYGNGFTFEPGNVEELRKYLVILIYNDKLRRDMGTKSSLLVKEKLNWASITTSYLDTYSQVIKKQ